MSWWNRFLLCGGFGFSLLLAAQSAAAHTISLSYAEVNVEESRVRWLIRMPVPELDLLFELDKNHDGAVDGRELQQGSEQLRSYVSRKVAVVEEGHELPGMVGGFRLWNDPQGFPFVETEVLFTSPKKLRRLSLRCDLLREAVSAHQTLARITAEGRTENFVFGEANRSYAPEGGSRAAAVLQFVRMGILHIFTGYDHIAFLLGIVLIGGRFKHIVKIVTSFTVAHSITLALAALDIVVLPTRFVESGIALSIMYIALENLFFKSFDRRWMVTFFFGLVHGFGFASALREVHLSRSLLGVALFSFNFGVEIGQVCIVGLLLPGLWYLQDKKFNGLVVKFSSAAIFLLGSVWFWQRASGG